MLLVSDLGEVSRDLEQHPLMRRDLSRPFFADTFVKISDRRAQGPSDFEQPSGGYTIDTALILMSLLIGHADHFGELLLGQAQHDAPFAYPASHMIVDCSGRTPSLRLSHAPHPYKFASDVLIETRSISFNAKKADKFRLHSRSAE